MGRRLVCALRGPLTPTNVCTLFLCAWRYAAFGITSHLFPELRLAATTKVIFLTIALRDCGSYLILLHVCFGTQVPEDRYPGGIGHH